MEPTSAAAKAATGSFCHWSALRPIQTATISTAGLHRAVKMTAVSSTGATGGMRNSRSPGALRGRLVFNLVAQFLLFVLDEPADHLAPQRLAQIRRHSLFQRACAHLVDHLLIAPGHVGFLVRFQLELPGALDVAEAFGDAVDQPIVDAVDLDPDLAQVAAGVCWSRAHAGLPFDVSASPVRLAPAALLAARRPSHQRSGTTKRPAASSITWPTRNSVASSNGLPISCRPNGVASEESPAGTDMPGRPAMFTVTVKMSLRYICTGSPETSPMPKAGPGVVGVNSTSTCSNTVSKSRLISVRTFCALR